MPEKPAFLTSDVADLEAYSRVPFQVFDDRASLYQHFARAVASEIRANNLTDTVTRLILPVGPVDQYPLLAALCNEERISWQNVHIFMMDEYCDWQGRAVPRSHPASFAGIFFRRLINALDEDLRPPTGQVHFPDPLAIPAISQAIQAVGGIDTCYGGVGYHGHVAFNEPPISRWFTLTPQEFRDSQTRVVTLAPETVVMNSIRATGGNPAFLPPMAVTLGLKDIFSAGRIRLYLPGGEWQRNAFRMAVAGEESVDWPVTLLQSHSDIMVFADKDTAQPPV